MSKKKYTAEEKYRAVAESRKSSTRELAQQHGIGRTTLVRLDFTPWPRLPAPMLGYPYRGPSSVQSVTGNG